MDLTNHPLNSNVNVSNNTGNNVNVRRNSKPSLQYIQLTANKMLAIFRDDQSFRFYCKVATQLKESFIWTQVEVAQTKRKPAAYFAATCKPYLQDLHKR